MGRIVYHLSPRSNKPVMPAIVVRVRETVDDLLVGMVDLHVFHPNSSGTNIVYGVKFSDKEDEGCWWWPPSLEQAKEDRINKEISRLDVAKKTEDSFRKQNQMAIDAAKRMTK